MEEQLNPLAITHLLQHALRSLCIHENSQWVYAVFWRILPRNYPPPKWDLHGGAFERSRGNRRNWILVWEDGFCNFAASSGGQVGVNCADSSAAYPHCEPQLTKEGLQPDLFFKMSHEIYNYGEGLIGKVAADHTHKWVFKEGQDQEVNFLTSWQNPADSHPRTWEAQFQSGIKTIALIAVKEGVVQLGALNKVKEDLSYVVLVRKRFSYLESIPGFLLPHPSSSPPATFPLKIDGCNPPENWPFAPPTTTELYSHFSPQLGITPSMRSLEDLLSKLPSIVPMQSLASPGYYSETPPIFFSPGMSPEVAVGMTGRVAKEKVDEESCGHEREVDFAGDNSSGSSSLSFHCFNVTKPSEGL